MDTDTLLNLTMHLGNLFPVIAEVCRSNQKKKKKTFKFEFKMQPFF